MTTPIPERRCKACGLMFPPKRPAQVTCNRRCAADSAKQSLGRKTNTSQLAATSWRYATAQKAAQDAAKPTSSWWAGASRDHWGATVAEQGPRMGVSTLGVTVRHGE